MRLNKQTSFNDFISTTEYLISSNYTKSSKLAAMGASNGGLLVGAVMLKRPDLFQVVVAKSGVFDMMRYHLFKVGNVYGNVYGNITDSLDFENLITYSPVHNVKNGVHYPATLLVAGDNDDRVSPFHSFKFIANLQASTSGINPCILYYEKKAGRYGSASEEMKIESDSYIYSFIYRYIGIENRIQYEIDR